MNNSLSIKYFAVEGWKKRDLDEADGWWEVLFQSSFSSFSLTKQHHNKGIVGYKAFIYKQQSLDDKHSTWVIVNKNSGNTLACEYSHLT